MNAEIAVTPGGSGTAAIVGPNPWLLAILVSLATFMEVLDTTIVNVALPYIAGGMATSMDEASWIVTSYLVANAAVITASSFLARIWGRKNFYLICVGLFTASSVLSGFAWNIQSLLLFRVMQGIGGGGMVPLSQSILADAFPPAKRGQGFAIFGIAVVVAPVVGPTLGGWLASNYGWQWCFLINGPVGLLAIGLVAAIMHERKASNVTQVRFDLVGFLLVATFLGALEVVLDRGEVDDWFASRFVIVFTLLCAGAFVLMIPWEATRRNPMLDVRMIATRHFGTCVALMAATGAILYSTTQFLPELVQYDFGYTGTWAGLMLSPAGLVTMAMTIIAGRLSGRIQPKYLIAIGAMAVAFGMYEITKLNPAFDFWSFAWTRIYIALGLPLIFISITVGSYDGMPESKTDEASAVINMARNTGGSIGISLAGNVLANREQFHQNRLVGNIVPSNMQYQDTLHQVTTYFVAHGNALAQAQKQAVAWIAQQLHMQASLMAFSDVFWTLMLISLAAAPLALLLRSIRLEAGAPTAH